MEPDEHLLPVATGRVNGLSFLVNGRGQLLALRSPHGAPVIVDRDAFSPITRASVGVTRWLALHPRDATQEDQRWLAARVLRSWRLSVAGDRLELDRAALHAREVARAKRQQTRIATLERPAKARMRAA
jgi:hypothetical protein